MTFVKSLSQTPQPFLMYSYSDSLYSLFEAVMFPRESRHTVRMAEDSLCCCTHWTLLLYMKVSRTKHKSCTSTLQNLGTNLPLWAGFDFNQVAIHLNLSRSLCTARQYSILLLVLRMLILGKREEQAGKIFVPCERFTPTCLSEP